MRRLGWAGLLLAGATVACAQGAPTLSDGDLSSWSARWKPAVRESILDSLAARITAGGWPERPASEAQRRWLETRLREAAIHRDPRFAEFFARRLSPADAAWIDVDEWRLLGALYALDADDAARAREWLEPAWSNAPVPLWRGVRASREAAIAIEAAEADSLTELAAGVTWRRMPEKFSFLTFAGTLAEAHVALARSDYGRAATLSADLRGSPLELAFAAELARRQGDEAEARRQERELLGAAAWRSSEMARAILIARLPVATIESASDLSTDDIQGLLEVAEAHRDLDRFLVIDSVLTARGISSDERPGNSLSRAERSLHGLRLAFATRAYDKVISHSWRRPSAAEDRGEIDFILARAYRNLGRPQEMGRHYQRVLDRPNAVDREEAWWEWARELEYLRRYDEADALYGKIVEADYGKRRADARLRRGYCRWLDGDLEGASRAFAETAARETGAAASAANFWMFRIHLRLGDEEAAERAIGTAADGTGYYALRARSQRLLQDRPHPGSVDGAPFESAEYWGRVAKWMRTVDADRRAVVSDVALEPDDPRASAIDAELWRLREDLLVARHFGRSEWVSVALDRLDRRPGLGDDVARARTLAQLGLPDLGARRALRAGAQASELKLPRAYATLVDAAAESAKVAPELLWAIMRRESFYESAARSPAGAVGLMQFMEPTAESTAAANGIAAAPRESPRVSIQLGAAHLRELFERDHAHVTKALAAYNAGMHNAVRWGGAEAEDPDVYLETIGFRETREYVMAVMEHFWAYMAALRGLDL